MNYYELAEDNLDTVKLLLGGKKYMQAVYYSCLAVEMYLKARHSIFFPLSDLDKTHDVIGLYRDLTSKNPSSKDLSRIMVTIRKYFNESRYPAIGTAIYTKEFAEQFLSYVLDIKRYIDHDCQIVMGDLQRKYNNKL